MMLENLYKHAVKEFETYFSSIAERIIGYHPVGRNEILFIAKDNSQYIYDTRVRAVRKLRPISDDNLTEEEWRTKFALRIRLRMMGMGLSQKDLADRTGIGCMSIHNYVSGKSTPSAYYAEKIAEALNCSIAELTRFE